MILQYFLVVIIISVSVHVFHFQLYLQMHELVYILICVQEGLLHYLYKVNTAWMVYSRSVVVNSVRLQCMFSTKLYKPITDCMYCSLPLTSPFTEVWCLKCSLLVKVAFSVVVELYNILFYVSRLQIQRNSVFHVSPKIIYILNIT